MRAILLLAVFAVGCSSPTAPTAVSAPVVPVAPVVSVPPVVTPPSTPSTPTPNPLLSDPRFSLSFYRDFALGVRDGGPYPLRRQAVAPRIYLRTIDDAGTPIDAGTLDATAAALINTAGSLTGVFGLAGLEQGTGTREGQAGWITVKWASSTSGNLCGTGQYGGERIVLYPKNPRCRCAGGPAVTLATVKHELGHTLGFYHTDNRDELMYHTVGSVCDRDPSAREIFHARVAYGQAIGSLNPS